MKFWSKNHPAGIFLRGMAMGAADVVPGVSGGTIAFLTGIYDELIATISGLNHRLIGLLFKHGLRNAWIAANGKFLVPLLLGIAVSIVSLASLLTRAIDSHPVLVWSFFFGLVLASIPLVVSQVHHFYTTGPLISFTVGAAMAVLISLSPAVGGSESLWYIFLCGSIAICAMILPGISGSFILLLLGAYTTVLGNLSQLVEGLKSVDMAIILPAFVVVLVFSLGCITGLLSFSRLLKYLLAQHRARTLAVLAGFLAGSLVKLWPWRIAIDTYVKHAGTPKEKVVVLSEAWVLPGGYPAEAQMLPAIGLFLLGAGLIWAMQRLSARNSDPA
jgi:putative membrane protein